MLRYFLPLFSILCFLSAGNSDLTIDRATLLRFRAAVNGRTRLWNLSDPTPCSWKGITCNSNGVTSIRLPGAGLSGEIPANSIGNITSLLTLSLRRNSLSGTLPSDLSSCTQLRDLNLQQNKFTGEIPFTIFSLTNIVRLDITGNKFSGGISWEFNKLTKLITLNMGNNQLTGTLPELDNLTGVTEFNVSSNRLKGLIPNYFQKFPATAFQENFLCGSPLNSCPEEGNKETKLSNGATAGIVVGSVAALLCVLFLSIILRRKYRIGPHSNTPPSETQLESSDYTISARAVPVIRTPTRETPVVETPEKAVPVVETPAMARNGSGNNGLVFFGERKNVFSFEDLLRASAEILGKESSIGSTYKAYLGVGNEMVVKRLKNVGVSEGEFREKVEKLGSLVHENLVPLKGYYCGKEEKLLVYDFMAMGSLFTLLHENRGTDKKILNWEARTRIAFQVARGIKYLHSLNITHGNIKSSNILLTNDKDAAAYVSEFGIPQLLFFTSTLTSIGYRAPEVSESNKISHEADVYSFGVLLLELLMGKSPVNPHTGAKMDLPRWGKLMAEGSLALDVFDSELLKYHHVKEKIFQLLFVAISCTTRDPEGRPNMKEVTGLLERIHIFS